MASVGWSDYNELDRYPVRSRERVDRTDSIVFFVFPPLLMLFRTRVFGALLFAVASLVGACGGPATLQPGAITEAPTIDGTLDEWETGLTYVSDQPVSMGVRPTDSLLYVAVSIQDQALVRSVVERGLIVWIDPSAEQGRTYGIRYPLGLRQQRADQGGSAEEAQSSFPSAEGDVSFSELEILEGNARRRLPAQFDTGLRGNVTFTEGSFIYELALPVGVSDDTSEGEERHGLRASLEAPFDVGLETPDSDGEREFFSDEPGIPSVTDGTGRRGQRRRGRRQRQPPAPEQETGLPTLDLWVSVPSRPSQP